MQLTKGITLFFLTAALGLMGHLGAEAQQSDANTLEQRVQELEQIVSTLQERIHILESKTFDAPGLTQEAILRWAAENGHGEIVQALLQKGADVNAKDAQGRTALMLAVERGHAAAVQVLLEHGADVNLKDVQNQTAAMRAKAYPLLLQVLGQYGAKLIEEPFIQPEQSPAASPTPVMQTLNAADSQGYPPLIQAASDGDLERVQTLLNQGANLNAQTLKGYTALMLAAAGNHGAIVQALLAKGADLNLQTDKGYTALMLAAAEGHAAIVRGLLERGSDAKRATESGHTALAIAEQQGNKEIITLLENAQFLIAPGRYEVTVDSSAFVSPPLDLTPEWDKKAREMCQGREYNVISRGYKHPGTDYQVITGVVQCQ